MTSMKITVLRAGDSCRGDVRGQSLKQGPLARRFYADKEALNFDHRFPVFVRFMTKILVDFRCRTQLLTTTGRRSTAIMRRVG